MSHVSESEVARTPDEARRRLAASAVPREIADVVERIQREGHAAVLVGGAVRDVLLGARRADWDVATSATPQEVQALFRHTVPTGVQHGTVTVLVGRRHPRKPVEVTTFRGEGPYEDGRRPTEVRFLRSLHDDLARRDFTINAFAWDPVAEVFTDAFGGLEDLRARLVRAVGEPSARFREDGLRTMRAVRFCATLGFALEAATEEAIPQALDVLDRVSRERVHAELVKLLRAPRPSLGLRPMARTGMWSRVVGEPDADARAAAIGAVDDMPPDATARLARLLLPLREVPGEIARSLDGLKPSKEERTRVTALTSDTCMALTEVREPAAIRRCVARLGPRHLRDAFDVLALDASRRDEIVGACANAVLDAKDLAIKGRDLIAAGIASPGRELGDVLDALFEQVLDDPEKNERETLLAAARAIGGNGSGDGDGR